jgi:hypothetical protein
VRGVPLAAAAPVPARDRLAFPRGDMSQRQSCCASLVAMPFSSDGHPTRYGRRSAQGRCHPPKRFTIRMLAQPTQPEMLPGGLQLFGALVLTTLSLSVTVPDPL